MVSSRGFRRVDNYMVLDDPMAEGGEEKELLDLVTKYTHHQNIAVFYLCQDMFPPAGKYADRESISRKAHYVIAFKNTIQYNTIQFISS